MSKVVKKSIEMSDVEISFLSLVDKAANKHKFLIQKNDSGKPEVKFSANILKSDTESHEVTGIVYEPLEADSHDNFMTAEEIQKAADWFNTNGEGVDVQHNTQVVEGVEIVKSWVTTEETTINGTVVKAGTWLATAKISNDEIWQKVEKGEITGWSMGGVGAYSTTDIDLESVEKSITQKFLNGIAKAFGFTYDGTSISETSFDEKYQEKNKKSSFWNAWQTLEDFLIPYESESSWATYYQDNAQVIKDALTGFSNAITDVLVSGDIAKALEPSKEVIEKSKAVVENSQALQTIEDITKQLGSLKASLVVNKKAEEDEEMTAEKIQELVSKSLEEALTPIKEQLDVLKGDEPNPEGEVAPEGTTEPEKKEEPEVNLEEVVKSAIAEAVTPLQKELQVLKAAKGISKQTDPETPETEDDKEDGEVTKSVFSGLFGTSK